MKANIQNKDRSLSEIDTSRIYVYDGNGNEFEITLNNFGELSIIKSDSSIIIQPCVSNSLILK